MSESTGQAPPESDRGLRLAALLAGALVLAYGAVTTQVWEDYWITFRSSRNLVDGLGLVFQPGEKVHTFTSPLGVLFPALGYALTGSEDGALWFFRAVGALALAGTAAMLVAHAREHGWPPLALAAGLAFGAFEAKQVAFSANGMESAILAFFTAFAWRELTRAGGPRWPRLALAYAGLMWTRPDAFLVAGAITAGWFAFQPAVPGGRSAWLRRVLPAIGVGGLLYAPWFFWAWWYYGSPVPQTIVAKSALVAADLSPLRILTAPLRCLVRDTGLDGLFAPPYFYATGWSADFVNLCRLLARVAAFAWLVPALPRPARAASLAVLVGGVYLNQVMPYPWYYAPWTFLGGVALAGVVHLALASTRAAVRRGGQVAVSLLLALAAILLAVTATNAWHQQRIVENRGRKPLGRWLASQARPGDSVFLESLGYIGYYSNLKTYDFPGLSSPEVSGLVAAGKRNYGELIAELRPSWVVVRPLEYMDHKLGDAAAMKDYEMVLVSDRRPLVEAVKPLPGRGLLEFDSVYMVYRRRADAPGTSPPP
ncbi:MAG TPA: hypothetical protein VEB66_17910 [Opitutaceae bacterium]|nr:hypothetical protein [Opitutaceae bacterium]